MRDVSRLLSFLVIVLAAVAGATSAAFAVPQAFRGDPALKPLVSGLPRLQIPLPAHKSHGKIKHVVIIMQENRGFDDLFQGYPGANTQSYGYDSNGNKIALAPIPLEANYDLNHDFLSFITDCNGTGSIPGTNCQNNGFNNEPTGCGRGCVDPQYGYVPASETTTYFNMAGQYVLADNMFTSQADDSFISHQYIISAQANHAVYFPYGSWGCQGGPSDQIATLNQNRTFGAGEPMCWDVTTLADELDTAGLSWRFYAGNPNGDGGLWSAYQNIHHIYYGKDWANVISPPGQILTDVANGSLSTMTWVTPTYENSDHSGFGSNTGPKWVASVVDAIGKSKYWKSTAIFVFWDEWGGWYDHVPPVYEDYDGLGFRVPMLIISPYAKQNYVSHVQYEHGSMLRFAEDEFGLSQMSAADARANSPAADAFDFAQKPRPFKSFAAPRVPVHRGYSHPPPGVNPD
jgi:phospholipase C